MALPQYKDIVDLIKKGSTLEAQEKIMELREVALLLQERNLELEAQLKASSDWAEQKPRYALVSPWRGPAQAYALKESCAEGEEPHLLCANCFHNSKRVILNPTKSGRFTELVCPACRASITTGYMELGPATYAETYLDKPK